jgi:Chaperone of endosialidase
MKSASTILFFLLLSHMLQAQSLAINTDGSTASSSALLDVKSTTKGMLIPRLTKAQKNAISTPATSLLIYQTGPDSTGFYYYQNSKWNWMTDNNKSDSSYWGLHGNNNTTPPSSANNAPINYATDTYLGTFDQKDVSFLAGGNELLRLKQVSGGGLIGLSNRNPEYGLDIRLSDQNPPSDIVGMRIVSSSLFDLNNSNNIYRGLVIGNNRSNANETVIWNHGNNLDAVIRIGFDVFSPSGRPAININQYGQGIYQRNPKYALDIHSRSQFAPATTSTNKNGVRVTYTGQETNNQEDRGLFMGVDMNSSLKSYVWNYADGTGGNASNKAIYFGVGPDMDLSNHLATMELQDGKIAMGHITDPTFFFPSTLNIQTDYASGVAKNGMSIMKHLVNGVESAYVGTDNNDNLNIFKYGGGNIFLQATNLENPITISTNNFVGIRTLTPNAEMQFGDTYANNKIVLHNNFWGNFPNNEHNFYGFGVNSDVLRYQVPKASTDHVFYSGNTPGTASVELMRITGDGFVGINNNNPQAPLEFANSAANRKIVLMSSANNDHNFLGFGTTGGDLRYQIPFGNFEHVFFAGDGGGSSSTELMKLKGTGELGIGITSPSFRLEVNGRMRIHSGGSNASSAGIWFNNNANNTNKGFVGMENDNSIGFYGTGTPNGWGMVMEISTGNVGIGTSGPTQKLHVIGNILATGTITPSDYRYKKNIHPLENALAKLQQLNGVTYEMNRQAFPEWNFEDTRQYGLIAQEVEKIFPEMVKTIDTKGYKGVDYVKLIPVLIEAIKDQQKEIEELRKAIQNK